MRSSVRSRRSLAALGLCWILLGGGCREEPAPPTALEGVWEDAGGEALTWIVTGDRYHFQGPDRSDWMKGTFRLEVGDPGVLDLVVEECDCDFEGERIQALFRLEGPTLVIASAGPDAPTPGSTTEGEGTRVFYLRRAGI